MGAMSLARLGVLAALASADPCRDALAGLAPGGSGHCAWSQLQPLLRPTQSTVGYAWVLRQYQKAFTSRQKAQEEMGEKPVPVVRGGDGAHYLVDHHHALCSLDLGEYDDVNVTVTLLCELSGTGEELWTQLAERNYAYLYGHLQGPSRSSLPTGPMTSELLPRTLSCRRSRLNLLDDPWRALSAFARKLPREKRPGCKKNCDRAYSKVCNADTGASIPFLEYKWAYFFNHAYLSPNKVLPSTDSRSWQALENFTARLAGLPIPASLGDLDADLGAWFSAAEDLSVLARADFVQHYKVPAFLGGAVLGELGWIPGGLAPYNTKDPTCSQPLCKEGGGHSAFIV